MNSTFIIFQFWNSGKSFIEIAILWFVFYRILVFFQGTRAFQVLKGIAYLVGIFLLSIILELTTINWLLTKIFGISIIAILIIFQQELRQGLARLGQQHYFSAPLGESEIKALIEQLTTAVFKLANKKTGCLIAIERNTKLNAYMESGIIVDGAVTEELLQSIFMPPSPLHDGGVIIRSGRVIAASCLFPLTENPGVHKITISGTRHRAALGMSEQTDAVVIMVSEENRDILVAIDGKFIPIDSNERFVNILENSLIGKANHKKK